jgi:hypothetical protein
MCHAKHCTQHTVSHFALQCSKKAGRAGRRRTPFIGLTARGAFLACEAGVSKAKDSADSAVMPRSWAWRGTSPDIGALTESWVCITGVPLLTTASQARHAPRLAPYVDADARLRDEG